MKLNEMVFNFFFPDIGEVDEGSYGPWWNTLVDCTAETEKKSWV